MDLDQQPNPLEISNPMTDISVFMELPQKIDKILESQPDENTKKSIKILFSKIIVILAGKYTKTDPFPIEVIDNLFIGSIGAALSKENLKNANIGSVLVCAGLKPAFPDDFIYKQMNIKDSQDQEVISLFEDSNNFIRENLQNGRKVLVHWYILLEDLIFCYNKKNFFSFAGKSRSTTFLIAFFIKVGVYLFMF